MEGRSVGGGVRRRLGGSFVQVRMSGRKIAIQCKRIALMTTRERVLTQG
jgi:hypothetical protein